MAQAKEFQKSSYPLPVYNFRVTVDGVPMSFSQVSGISLEHDKVTYRHGLSAWEGEGIKKYRINKYVPVTMKKGTVKHIDFLYDWLQDTKGSTRTLAVSLCDEKGQPVVTWRMTKALPVKLEAPSFDANTNEVSIESLKVMVCGISLEHHEL